MRTALVIGAGGLGGPVLVGLASAGVERITVVDDDRVDATNLGRQLLFGDQHVGREKAVIAAEEIHERFPSARVEPRVERFGRDSRQLLRAHQIVIDGSDNFETRFLANDLRVAEGIPLVHGAAIRWEGQLLTILPGETACLRCVFEGEPSEGTAPTCAQAGVASPLVGLVGGWMAEAAVQVLAGLRPSTAGAVRVFDGWSGRDRLAQVGRDPGCKACGAGSPGSVKSRSVVSGI